MIDIEELGVAKAWKENEGGSNLGANSSSLLSIDSNPQPSNPSKQRLPLSQSNTLVSEG